MINSNQKIAKDHKKYLKYVLRLLKKSLIKKDFVELIFYSIHQ